MSCKHGVIDTMLYAFYNMSSHDIIWSLPQISWCSRWILISTLINILIYWLVTECWLFITCCFIIIVKLNYISAISYGTSNDPHLIPWSTIFLTTAHENIVHEYLNFSNKQEYDNYGLWNWSKTSFTYLWSKTPFAIGLHSDVFDLLFRQPSNIYN